MKEPPNKSFAKFLRKQSQESFLRAFTCEHPVGSPEHFEAQREYDRSALLFSYAELFYSHRHEAEDNI